MPATEPTADRDPSHLAPAFRAELIRWEYLMAQRACFVALIEGRRTLERQQWLYAQGRTRPGPKVTPCDGIKTRSKHQDGIAADYWARTKDGRVYCPGPLSPFWEEFAACAAKIKLVTLEKKGDFDHIEMPEISA